MKSNSYTNREFKSYFFVGIVFPPTPSGVCDKVQELFTAAHAVVDRGFLFVAVSAVLAAATGVVVIEITSVGPAVVVVIGAPFGLIGGVGATGGTVGGVVGSAIGGGSANAVGGAVGCCFANFLYSVGYNDLLVAEGGRSAKGYPVWYL